MANEVICGFCKHYLWFLEEKSIDEAICYIKVKRVSGYDKVCEEYFTRDDIHTNRTIPKYCKHYNDELKF